jgi:hypothetical protein
MFYSKKDIETLGYKSMIEFAKDYMKTYENCFIIYQSNGLFISHDFDTQSGLSNMGTEKHIPQPIITGQYPVKNYKLSNNLKEKLESSDDLYLKLSYIDY